MKMNYKPMLALVLAVSMGVSGCSVISKKETPMLRIDDNDYSAKVVDLILEGEIEVLQKLYGESCWDNTINGSEFDEVMKPMVQDDVMRCLVFGNMAVSEGLTLSEDEQTQVDRIASKILTSHYKKASQAETAMVNETAKIYYLSQKYQNNIRSVAGSSISDDQATVIRGRQLVIHFNNDEERADAKMKMNQVLDLLNSGKTFNQLVSLYSDSDVIMVEFRKNQVTAEWERELFSVPAGQISGLIERDDCYMLYQSIDENSDDMTEDNKSSMVYTAEDTLLQSTYDKYVSAHQIWWDYDTWNKIELKDYIKDSADIFSVYGEVVEE